MKKNGFVQILIPIIIIVVLVVGGWYLLAKNKQINQNPKVEKKEFITKGAFVNSKADFPKLSFVYPSDWQVKEDANFGDKSSLPFEEISITKMLYSVHISQQILAGGGGNCHFKDSLASDTPQYGPSFDLTMVNYEETDSSFGRIRYFLDPLNTDNIKNIYSFCVRNENEWFSPGIGDVYIKTPPNPDVIIFTEALNIVKSIKPI